MRQYLFDIASWAVAVIVAGVLRFEFDVQRLNVTSIAMLIGVIALVQFLCSMPMRLYQHRYHYGSFEEVVAVGITALLNCGIEELFVLFFYIRLGIPRTLMLIALPMALLLMLGVRYMTRLLIESNARNKVKSVPAIVYGAGYAGSEIVRQLSTDVMSPYEPVALLDDDPNKRHARIRKVNVEGTFSDLAQVARRTRAKVLIVAISYADAKLLRRVADEAKRLGLDVRVVPTIEKMLGSPAQTTFNLRALSLDDLIGRQPVDTNLAAVGGYLTGKRVLITGAGGSIGIELCHQVHRFNPAELIMLDRDETNLQAAQYRIKGHGLLNTPEVVLADIRDAEAIKEIFLQRSPDVVFHAAALKHLPMLQQYPAEAWKTNVIGTLNVLNAADAAQVTTFVNISTDKAADPTSVLGYSKLFAEKLTAYMARKTDRHYISVRFGNVLGSRGSMSTLFALMIEDGGPIQLTHPEVTRYFMSIPEACQLVLQAGAIGKPGEALILDMGEPVLILDIAKRMIEMSGKKIDIDIVGLREGEKLHEQLVSSLESAEVTEHKKISHSRVEALSPDELDFDAWMAQVSGG
ncbi:MAG: polysaccharide biosynthesis protein [Propionibacteriaceae bacterium]|jgi:dTDP-glucose 4,6-dehydratase|nr:polysaccharide biosynthesis protein [Propionibacteriaceae bacterium]